ncbi:hypothetical protein GCK72_019723 [Caenorhabditis remanei]|uniref:Uncharacterized protein n=1 Tax=Caenorhabditis remanei TaxID=31234 RepID=A0A6A5GD47_CAERE|nr:hypothetical protein GCK72_019723 [Caenorhabditis remanei]KAF1753167.1 hypothetical protein GCK72_019723 [Caenorhabditis remanei]
MGLLSYIGVSNLVQVILSVLSVYCMAGSYIYVFESRSNSLQMNRFRVSSTWARIVYHSSVYIINCSVLLLLFKSPEDQEIAKLDVLKMEPCPTEEFFKYDMFILTTDYEFQKITKRYIGPGLIFHVMFHILFHVICTVYYLFLTPNKVLSPETRRIQKKFFIGTVFQTTIPLAVLVILLVGILLDQLTNSFTQGMVNLAIIGLASHGIGESLAIILVHRSYRRAVWELMTRKKIEKDECEDECEETEDEEENCRPPRLLPPRPPPPPETTIADAIPNNASCVSISPSECVEWPTTGNCTSCIIGSSEPKTSNSSAISLNLSKGIISNSHSLIIILESDNLLTMMHQTPFGLSNLCHPDGHSSLFGLGGGLGLPGGLPGGLCGRPRPPPRPPSSEDHEDEENLPPPRPPLPPPPL